jgi:hypothetical protein
MILSCPFCKAKADPAHSTCSSCGKVMSRACPACAETIASNSTSCKYCGEGVAPMKEPAPVKASLDSARDRDPGIVFIEETPRKKKCCAGRTMFWLIVMALAGFCAYSAVKTKVNCHPVKHKAAVEQKINIPETTPKGKLH